MILSRSLRTLSKKIVRPSPGPSRISQARDQQLQTFSDSVYSAGNTLIWIAAFFAAAEELGINAMPIALLAGLALVGLGFGTQTLVRDILAGFHILFEDQFVAGDTIQSGDTLGRVEQLSLRRTVIRDSRGALVTVANGDLRVVANLSRDWSQVFVDVSVAPLVAQETILCALDAVATELREDSVWSAILVDGPRVLGLQSYDQTASIFRLQVRTAPSRQEDAARELRRRIQLEFQRKGISLSNVQRIELVNPPVSQETPQHASTA